MDSRQLGCLSPTRKHAYKLRLRVSADSRVYRSREYETVNRANSKSFNRLKPNVIMWLHFKCSAQYRPNLPFLISDIRALWCS